MPSVDAPIPAARAALPDSRERIARRLTGAALLVLLACLGARPFLCEMQFRSSTVQLDAPAADASDAANPAAPRYELSRVTFATLLLAAGVLWLAAGAVRGALVMRHGYLAALILLFGALSLVSAAGASDRRSAMDAWIEQVSLLAGCFLAIQLCDTRRRFALVVAVLAGIGVTLACRACWEILVEIPARISNFEMYRDEHLRGLGMEPGSPAARAFEVRVRDYSPLGFFSLANLFGSLLILLLLATAGQAWGKLRSALRNRRGAKRGMARGEIHLPTLAAGVSLLGAAMVAVTLVLTKSRGAALAAGLALAAAMFAWRHRRALAHRWKRWALGTLGVFVLLAGATVAYGLATDKLPSKTLTFRWYYWTGAAQLVRDHPLWGVGPANFGTAYLQVRRPAAEETVKMPHNVVMNSLAQFGVPGGAVFLAIVLVVLIGAWRPIDPPPGPRFDEGNIFRRALVLVPATVLLARLYFAGCSNNLWMALLDALLPAMVLAGAMLAMGWKGSRLKLAEPYGLTRIALAAGCAGFFLHNMIEFGFWMPGTAMVFWVAGGACLANTGRTTRLRLARWPLAAAAAAGVTAAVIVCWYPVAHRTVATERLQRALILNQADAAALARETASADPLDAISASDTARILVGLAPHAPADASQPALREAFSYALRAVARDRADQAHALLAGDLAWILADPSSRNYPWKNAPDPTAGRTPFTPRTAYDFNLLAAKAYAADDYAAAADHLRQALRRDEAAPTLWWHLAETLVALRTTTTDPAQGTFAQARAACQKASALTPRTPLAQEALGWYLRTAELNPMDGRLRIRLAERFLHAGQPQLCLDQLNALDTIQKALFPDSSEVIKSPRELRRLATLRATAEFLLKP